MTSERTRPTAVAGRFYPREPASIRAALEGYLSGPPASADVPKALIVPHAGWIYSGEIAATAYRQLTGHRGEITRIVLLGPAHRVHVRGLARVSAAALATPLGALRVDERLDELVPWVPADDAAHAEEHALEVQLPFLRHLFGDRATIAPFVVGDAAPSEVARVLEALWGGDETLIVVSSDLSHYLPYDEARQVDADTARAIVHRTTELGGEQACGARPILGLLEVARLKGLEVSVLDLRTSGDTAGDRGQVVGYGAFAVWRPARPPRADERGPVLLALARAAMERALGARTSGDAILSHGWLDVPGATFVTLRNKDGELHGCIGSLEPRRPLGVDVQRNAVSAAVEDPRAPMVGPEAAADLRVEVSVLGPMEPIAFRDRADLLGQLTHDDGVLLTWDGHRGTYLPQVWEDLPDASAFLASLERKAGIPSRAWTSGTAPQAFRYHVVKYREEGA